MVSANSNSVAGKYDYQSKELQDELGLNWHDFGFRNYDATIGRWFNIDPLAEDFYSYSIYNAMMNNPIGYIDPDGRAADWINNGDGSWTAQAGDSASTLARDAGISFERAKEIMANTAKSNSSLGNMGTYVDPKDGVEKSAVDPGDIVIIPEQAEVIALNQEGIKKAKEGINSDLQSIDDLNGENSSLLEEKKVAIERHELKKSVKAFESDPSDRSAGAWAEIGSAARTGAIEIRVNRAVKKNNETIDSLKREIAIKQKEIQTRKNIINNPNSVLKIDNSIKLEKKIKN
ncbi:MAG: hypothetical protein Wins2KO_31710 [Winogradskyella sp.]